MEGLSVNYIDSTNKDVEVTYTPSSLVSNYSYIIIKDNNYGNSVYKEGSTPFSVTFSETGTYKIEITNTYSDGTSDTISSGEYKIDKEAPIININSKTQKIHSNEKFDFMSGITASDIVDGDLTKSITTNIDTLDFSKEGIKELKYSVQDSAGNLASEIVYVTVYKDNTSLVRFGQIGIFIIILFIVIFLNKYIRSIKLEKRFSKYTVNSSKNSSISLFDNLYNQYMDFLNKLSKILGKFNIIKKLSLKYDKYREVFELQESNLNFMSKKIVIGFVYIVFAIIIKLIQSQILKPIEMFIPFILGYYTLDIIYFYKFINYRKKIQNDMLEAITVMNNAFKAGMSITQAVELVAKELKGPIAKEFEKISMELSFGLDVETVFKRFSSRIKLDEAVYLTSGLSVLNKTGGNIIKVFDSIEKTIFSKKKLQQEFKALTSSSKMIMYVLIIVPAAFILFINIINRDYFKILFESSLGIILIIIMLIIYITYIIVVRKVMKVRGIK